MEGKLVKIIGGLYYVRSGTETYALKPLGIFRHKQISILVGDEVAFDAEGSITSVLPRKNELKRPSVANIDQVILVVALTAPQFSEMQVFKMLGVIESQFLKPMIIFTKSDLAATPPALATIFPDYEYHVINAREALAPILLNVFRNKISVATGDSGVGKSTIVQQLVAREVLVGTISVASQRGKHTTRVAEIMPLRAEIGVGGIIDTPGFSSVDLPFMPQQWAQAFAIFRERSARCRFTYCLHDKEPEADCQIKRDVRDKLISEAKYTNYLKLLKEVQNEKNRRSINSWPKRSGHPRNKTH